VPEAPIPKLSVIIPTYQRREALALVLAALARQTLAADEYEVVVVLDGPDAEVEAMLDALLPPFALRWFVQPHRGDTSARNLGLRQAQGEILVYLDDDAIPEPGLLAAHLDRHRDPDLVVIGAVNLHPQSPQLLVGEAVDYSPKHFARCSQPGYVPDYRDLSAANFSVRKRHITAVGGFDEGFQGYGGPNDRELALRLTGQGLRLVFESRAFAGHYVSKSWARLLRDNRDLGRANRYFFSKNPERVRDLSVTTYASGSWLRQLLFRLAGVLPEAAFRDFEQLVGHVDGANLVIGRGLGRLVIRTSRALFELRGAWEDPEWMRAFRRRLRARVPAFRIPPDSRFEERLERLLARGYNLISARDFFAWHAQLGPLPDKPVLVTVDAPSREFLSRAAEGPHPHPVPAIAFLSAEELGRIAEDEARRLHDAGWELQVLDDGGTLNAGLAEKLRAANGMALVATQRAGSPPGGFDAAFTRVPGDNTFRDDRFQFHRTDWGD
jgi:glycosyltransferase involved in cell wall biosynthesis